MRNTNFLGLGFEIGQDQRGLRRSPDYVRRYFPVLEPLGLKMIDHGDIAPPVEKDVKFHSSEQIDTIDWQPFKEAYKKISGLLSNPETLVNWGGDHSVAISTVSAFCARHPEGSVLWIDAHADLNLPKFSPTGNLHGMPLSILLNLQDIRTTQFSWLKSGLSGQKLIYLGIRDLDPFEQNSLQALNIKTYTAETVRSRGMRPVAKEIFNLVAAHPLHISFDIDSLSPEYAPATGISVPNGLSLDDLRILGQELSGHRKISSVDVVEINPDIGNETEVFQTNFAALNFLMSLLSPGGIYDGTGRTNQELYPAPMESCPQI